jgi:hypothetical protein
MTYLLALPTTSKSTSNTTSHQQQQQVLHARNRTSNQGPVQGGDVSTCKQQAAGQACICSNHGQHLKAADVQITLCTCLSLKDAPHMLLLLLLLLLYSLCMTGCACAHNDGG